MAAVLLYIAKFGREVLIDEDHPLAIAQRAAPTTATSAEVAVVDVAPTVTTGSAAPARATRRGRGK